MQLKIFNAASSAAVLAQIKAELGSDAIILETREEGGQVFMTAALERDYIAEQDNEDATDIGPARPAFRNAAAPEAPARFSARFPDAQHVRLRRQGQPAYADSAAAARERNFGSSLDFTRAPLTEGNTVPLSAYGSSGKTQWNEGWSGSDMQPLMEPAPRLEHLQPRQRLALEYLQREGVEEQPLMYLYDQLLGYADANVLVPLATLVPVRPWGEPHWPQRVHLVAGPFGAGKTSVAIRMALNLRRETPDCRICLINADAARGNGRLLLRHYCDLSDLVYKEASSTLELITSLDAALQQGYDRILIDLPGLGRDGTLTRLLEDAGLDERCGERRDDAAVHLTLPPHYASRELQALLERYYCPHAGSLIWTKLDEAEHFGQIVNVGAASGLPVSSLSFGPGLGSSLVSAREVLLWRMLFKRELPESA